MLLFVVSAFAVTALAFTTGVIVGARAVRGHGFQDFAPAPGPDPGESVEPTWAQRDWSMPEREPETIGQVLVFDPRPGSRREAA